jgi:hypothetical protein
MQVTTTISGMTLAQFHFKICMKYLFAAIMVSCVFEPGWFEKSIIKGIS